MALYVNDDYVVAEYAQTGVTIIWGQKIIFVPKSELALVQSSPTEIRQLDLNVFRLTLKDLEDDADGMAFLNTHNHNTTITVGGVTLARVLEIINGYTITFEDGQYAVNLIGANSNIADRLNVNQVSVRAANSAGLVNNSTPADIANAVWTHSTATDMATKITLVSKILRNKTVTDPATGIMTVYDDNGTTVLLTAPVFENAAGTVPYQGAGAENRGRLQ